MRYETFCNKRYYIFEWEYPRIKSFVRWLMVSIFKVAPDKRIKVSSLLSDITYHDGKEENGYIIGFSYILTSTGYPRNTSCSQSIITTRLYITEKFDQKVLESIDIPEIEFVKNAIEVVMTATKNK